MDKEALSFKEEFEHGWYDVFVYISVAVNKGLVVMFNSLQSDMAYSWHGKATRRI